MVGLKEDEIILTPLEKAIKGKSEINKLKWQLELE